MKDSSFTLVTRTGAGMAELIKAEFQIRPRGVSVFGICRTPTHDNGGGGCPQAGILAAWGGAVDKHLLLEGRSCGWLAAPTVTFLHGFTLPGGATEAAGTGGGAGDVGPAILLQLYEGLFLVGTDFWRAGIG